MKYYPIALRIKHKPVLVIGGGLIAQRKVLSLLDAGADVTIVAPVITKRLHRLVKDKHLKWRRHKVSVKDIVKSQFVIAATDDRIVNRNVFAWAQDRNIWVNVVDNVSLSNFISPALFHKGKAIVAVYTDGREPKLSRDLKNFLKEHWHEFLRYRCRLQ